MILDQTDEKTGLKCGRVASAPEFDLPNNGNLPSRAVNQPCHVLIEEFFGRRNQAAVARKPDIIPR